jgi:transcriptional regulator with XRE-family HTH domain
VREVSSAYLVLMDKDWLKRRLRVEGKTSADLAVAIGRDRAVVSRIMNGHQQMTIDQAKIFAAELGVDVAEVLQRTGMTDAPTAQAFTPGFAESDAAPFVHGPGMTESNQVKTLAQAFGERAGVDVWRVKSAAMVLGGYLPGDFMLVDTHQAERTRAGDVVLAQIYSRDSAATVLRRFEAPVLVAASADPAEARVHVVDGVNVVIRGKVVASWRV